VWLQAFHGHTKQTKRKYRYLPHKTFLSSLSAAATQTSVFLNLPIKRIRNLIPNLPHFHTQILTLKRPFPFGLLFLLIPFSPAFFLHDTLFALAIRSNHRAGCATMPGLL